VRLRKAQSQNLPEHWMNLMGAAGYGQGAADAVAGLPLAAKRSVVDRAAGKAGYR
jgi:hypothetical protein